MTDPEGMTDKTVPPPSAPGVGVVVLGMHRSGTSLTAHLLGRLGLSYGGPLVEARSDNPLGYYEHAGVVDIHNRFLNALERRWDDPRPLVAEDFAGRAAERARAAIRSAYAEGFAGEPRWVLKDPRMCTLLPLWDEVFETAAHDVFFFHVVRDPHAVAESIAARDGLPQEKAFLLWLRHNLESERYTRGRRRLWARLGDFLAKPEELMRRACERMGLGSGTEALRSACGEVVSPSHVHHRAVDWSSSPLGDAFPWVRDAYRALLRLCAEDEDAVYPELDGVAAELAAADRLFLAGLVAPVEAFQTEMVSDRMELLDQAEEATDYARSLEEAYHEKVRVVDEYVTALLGELEKKDQYIGAQQAQIDELRARLAASPGTE